MLWNPSFDWAGPPYHFIDMFAGEGNASRMWTFNLLQLWNLHVLHFYHALYLQPMQCRKHKRFHCARFDLDYGKGIGRPLNCFAHDWVLTEWVYVDISLCLHDVFALWSIFETCKCILYSCIAGLGRMISTALLAFCADLNGDSLIAHSQVSSLLWLVILRTALYACLMLHPGCVSLWGPDCRSWSIASRATSMRNRVNSAIGVGHEFVVQGNLMVSRRGNVLLVFWNGAANMWLVAFICGFGIFDQDGSLLDRCSSCTRVLRGWAAEDCREGHHDCCTCLANMHFGMMCFCFLQAVDPLWVFSLEVDSRENFLCTLDELFFVNVLQELMVVADAACKSKNSWY